MRLENYNGRLRRELNSFWPVAAVCDRRGFLKNLCFHGGHRPPLQLASNSRRAFTLVEMVVVVVLIGVMAAMIIPEMKGSFDDSLLRSTGRDLVNAFSLASSRAVSLNQSYRVRLDTHGGRFLIERQKRDSTGESFVPLKDVPGAEGKLDQRIAVQVSQSGNDSNSTGNDSSANNNSAESAAPDTVSFYPDGTADPAEIRLRDRDGFQLVLKLNPITARVHLSEPEHP